MTLAQHKNQMDCPKCEGIGNQRLTAPMVSMDYAGYECPVSGRWIEGKKAHEENLKRTGCRIFEPGEREQFIRKKAHEDVALERQIDEDVGRFVDNLGPAERESLGKDLERFDLNTERTIA